MASEMAFQPIGTASITTHGTTRTTTFTTTITAPSYQRTFINILVPSPPIAEPVQYTSGPRTVGPASKYSVPSIQVLMVTEVEAIILNVSGSHISTGTFLQPP